MQKKCRYFDNGKSQEFMTIMSGLRLQWLGIYVLKDGIQLQESNIYHATIATNAMSFLTRARYIYIIIGPNLLDFLNASSAGYDRV